MTPMPDETKTKIESIEVKILDDGSFLYRVHPEPQKKEGMMMGGDVKEYATDNLDKILSWVKDDLSSPHVRKEHPSKEKTEAAFREVHENEPRAVVHTRKKFGPERAKKQLIAIALSKARGKLYD